MMEQNETKAYQEPNITMVGSRLPVKLEWGVQRPATWNWGISGTRHKHQFAWLETNSRKLQATQ
jgi:hypothetical protein